jgi:hypothetical protein
MVAANYLIGHGAYNTNNYIIHFNSNYKARDTLAHVKLRLQAAI